MNLFDHALHLLGPQSHGTGWRVTDSFGTVTLDQEGRHLTLRDERPASPRTCQVSNSVRLREALRLPPALNTCGLTHGEVLTPCGRMTFSLRLRRERHDPTRPIEQLLLSTLPGHQYTFSGVTYDMLRILKLFGPTSLPIRPYTAFRPGLISTDPTPALACWMGRLTEDAGAALLTPQATFALHLTDRQVALDAASATFENARRRREEAEAHLHALEATHP